MMRLKFILFFVVLLNLYSVFGNSINLELEKTVYGPGSLIDGNIILNLSSELDLGENPDLILSLEDDIIESRNVIEILSGLDPALELQRNSFNAINPGIQKDLSLNQKKLFGFKLLKGSEVNKLEFNIEGINSNSF